MGIDFQKGLSQAGVYFPPLKDVDTATRFKSNVEGKYYHYEPGNGTRYEVIFTDVETKYENLLIMTLTSPRRCSMIVPKHQFGLHDIDYMVEKTGMMIGDCYAIIQLINHHLGATNDAG